MVADMREPDSLVQVRADAPQLVSDGRRLGPVWLAMSARRAGRGQHRRADERHRRSAGPGRRRLDEARLGGRQADAERYGAMSWCSRGSRSWWCSSASSAWAGTRRPGRGLRSRPSRWSRRASRSRSGTCSERRWSETAFAGNVIAVVADDTRRSACVRCGRYVAAQRCFGYRRWASLEASPRPPPGGLVRWLFGRLQALSISGDMISACRMYVHTFFLPKNLPNNVSRSFPQGKVDL